VNTLLPCKFTKFVLGFARFEMHVIPKIIHFIYLRSVMCHTHVMFSNSYMERKVFRLGVNIVSYP